MDENFFFVKTSSFIDKYNSPRCLPPGSEFVVGEIQLFLRNSKEQFIRTIQEKILPKIYDDVHKIIQNHWADSVSFEDLFHCHLLIDQYSPKDQTNFPEILSGDRIIFLYHSRERMNITKDRNILSSLDSIPWVDNSKKTLFPDDLAKFDCATVYFCLTQEELRKCTSVDFEVIFQYREYFVGLDLNF
jgi:hypothetical protein